VDQRNLKLFTELDQRLRPERGSIVGDNFAGTAKSGYDILQEADNYFVISTSGGGSFYPFGEIVCHSQDESVLTT
jgi:hypothetical protein